MLSRFLKKYPLLIVLGLALLIRITYFLFVIVRNPEGIYIFDSYGYWQIAFNLKEYGIFSQSYQLPLEPDYYRTPLYPLFIMFAEAIGPEGITIIILQILIAVGSCYLTYRLAFDLTMSSFIAFLSGIIVAFDIPSIVMNTIVLTETLFTFLLLSSVYGFMKYLSSGSIKALLVSALLCGGMILCRPIGFFVPFFYAGFILFRMKNDLKKMILHVLLISGLVATVISPWLIRNKITFGHFFLSVIREHNMQNYEAGAIYAELHGRTLAESQSILRWKSFREFKGNANKQPYEYAKFIESQAISLTLENPGIFLEHHVKQFLYFFLKPCRAYIDIQLGYWGSAYNTIPKNYPLMDYMFKHNSILTIAAVLFQMLVLILVYPAMLISFFFFRMRKKKLFFVFLASLILCMAVLTLPAVAESRFRVPVMPFIAILAASGVYLVKERYRRKGSVEKEIADKDGSDHPEQVSDQSAG
ncbi:MAG TPA: glycosyltransferase family 39 protein [Bacteroidia bacterium]|jgi:4-amino-4-deoxy-L-arabinose transferase-like glycosyltransferase